MLTSLQKGIILLIKSALCNDENSLPDDFNFEDAYLISKSHQILPLVYYGGFRCGFPSREIENKFYIETLKNISLSENQIYYTNLICDEFKKYNIDFITLKGTQLKKLYKKSEMRVMSDADILIKVEQYKEIKQCLRNLEFEFLLESDHEFVWKKGIYILELHKSLIPSYDNDYYSYFADGWSLAKLGEDDQLSFSVEDNFIYNFTHLAKHYRDGGIGLKHFVDVFVYLNYYQNIDKDYIDNELKKLKLFNFYQNVLKTLECWFNERPFDEVAEIITVTAFNSGAYGTINSRMVSSATKRNYDKNYSKIRELIFSIFQPLQSMRWRYPILKKAPFLLPVMWLVRLLETLLFKRQNLKQKQLGFKNITNEKIEKFKKQLMLVGLD